MADIRVASFPRDLPSVDRLWFEYLSWGNDGLEANFGFRLPVRETVDHDLATITKFAPPDGQLLLAVDVDVAVGIGCLRRSTADIAEIKRMYVQPSHRRAGLARAMLDALVTTARAAGYRRLRLDSPNFLTAAHALYRSSGFVDIAPYAESEIPDQYKAHWVFMERTL
ncbi:MAG: GNAT family N-acetyltransferase [Proteobacteria bacterium]|nr:GNAT family N-acetyltransferase [Pseudomonadota bacterium]